MANSSDFETTEYDGNGNVIYHGPASGDPVNNPSYGAPAPAPGPAPVAPTPTGPSLGDWGAPAWSPPAARPQAPPTTATPTAPTATTGGTPVAPTSTAGPNPAALADPLITWLESIGLSSLNDFVRQAIINGDSADTIYLNLRGTPEYKQRFAANDIRKANGLPPESEANIIQYESDARSLERRYGLPLNFFDTNKLIGGGVSISELSDRATSGFARMLQAPQEAKDAFTAYYGESSAPQALAAFYMDPDHSLPFLQRAAEAAGIGGAATRHGFGFDRNMAERLASLGQTDQSVDSGFQKIEQLAPAFAETISEHTDLTPGTTGVSAEFGLDQGQSQKAIEKRLDERAAAFGGNEHAMTSQKGDASLGVADS